MLLNLNNEYRMMNVESRSEMFQRSVYLPNPSIFDIRCSIFDIFIEFCGFVSLWLFIFKEPADIRVLIDAERKRSLL